MRWEDAAEELLRALLQMVPDTYRGLAEGTARSEAELKKASLKIQAIWAEKLPKIPLVTRNDIWVYNKKVHGWRPTQTMLYPLYNDVWLES